MADTTQDDTMQHDTPEGKPTLRSQKRTLQLMGILCMAWMFYALDGAVIQVIITNKAFLETFNINDARIGLFSLFPSIGALIGQIGVAGLINRYLGRKKSFLVATFLVIFGVVLQTFTGAWVAVLLGRIIMGLGGDTNGLVLGYYVTEIAPKHIRGRVLILVQQFSSQLIGIAGTWISYGISYLPQEEPYSWKVANSLQFIPGVVFFCLVFLLPESPRWLARKHRTDDQPMIKALCFIRDMPADDPRVLNEVKEIRDYDNWFVEHGTVQPWNIFTSKRLFKRCCYCFVPFLATQLCGVQTLGFYLSIIYQQLGIGGRQQSLLLVSCQAILNAIAALGSSWVVERFGRRPCIVWGHVANFCGLCIMLGLAMGFPGNENMVANGWIMAFVILITANYWFLITGPTVVYVNEIMPSQAREVGVAMSNVIPIALGIALGQEWPTAATTLGPKSYSILVATSGLACVLNYVFIKEPKGLSIEHIDQLFGEADHVEEYRHEVAQGESRKNSALVEEKEPGLHFENKDRHE